MFVEYLYPEIKKNMDITETELKNIKNMLLPLIIVKKAGYQVLGIYSK